MKPDRLAAADAAVMLNADAIVYEQVRNPDDLVLILRRVLANSFSIHREA